MIALPAKEAFKSRRMGVKMRDRRIYFKIGINMVWAILIVLFIVLIVPKLLGFFLPFVIGWIIAMIANPLVKLMEKRVKIVRKHSSAIIIIVVLAAVIGGLYLLFSFLIREIIALSSDFPTLYNNAEKTVQDALHELNTMLPKTAQNYLNDFILHFNDYVTKYTKKIEVPTLSDAGVFAKNIAEGLFMTIMTILSAYFFIAERENLITVINKVTPDSTKKYYHMIMDNFKKAVGGYLKAQFKIMLIITVILFLGFQILGVGYAILLAFAIAFLDLLPIFGTGAIIWPWAIIDMVSGNYFRAVGLVILYLICQVLKQLLQPKMVGDSIGLSPLMTLFFMFTGYQIKGVLGLLLGIPIGMILINFYRAGVFNTIIRGAKIIVHDINEYRKF